MKNWLQRVFHVHRRDYTITWAYAPTQHECRCGKKMGDFDD